MVTSKRGACPMLILFDDGEHAMSLKDHQMKANLLVPGEAGGGEKLYFVAWLLTLVETGLISQTGPKHYYCGED